MYFNLVQNFRAKMLIPCKFSVVGLNLLLLTHIAHTYVLLTANMEDVRKLARKFVSESIANQIVDFIAKATETMMNNTSEGHETISSLTQDISHQVSEENNKYNIEKHGLESAAQDTLKFAEEAVKKEKDSSSSDETTQETVTTKRDSKIVLISNPYQSHSRYISNDDKQTDKVTNEGEDNNKSTDIQNNLEAIEGKKPKKKEKHERYKLLSRFTSVEDNGVADHFAVDNRTTPDDFPENETFQKRALENEMILSKIQAEDYDQYDSRKVGVFPTSGPMSLLMPQRRLGHENWWDKELPKPDTPQVPEG